MVVGVLQIGLGTSRSEQREFDKAGAFREVLVASSLAPISSLPAHDSVTKISDHTVFVVVEAIQVPSMKLYGTRL